MSEYFRRLYSKEEEFVWDYRMLVPIAVEALGVDWQPNYDCNDGVRKNQEYFVTTGQLNRLVFDSAAVHHDDKGFSSVQISLKSSSRIVTVRVRREDNGYSAEKIIDRNTSESCERAIVDAFSALPPNASVERTMRKVAAILRTACGDAAHATRYAVVE